MDSISLNYEWRENVCRRMMGGQAKHSSIYSSKESLTNTSLSLALTNQRSRTTLSTQSNNSTINDETSAFSGVHHIFDNHKAAGKILVTF